MPSISPSVMASQYGWALAVLNADPELKKVFNQAVAKSWTPERFTAAVRNTNWYRKHSDTWRQNFILQRTNPGQWRQNYDSAKAAISQTALGMGAHIPASTLDKITKNYMSLGWNDAQLKQALSGQINFFKGSLGGEAGQTEDELRAFARANGVAISDKWILGYARAVAAGTSDVNAAKDALRQYAIQAFPVWANQLKAGVNLEDIASPYMQSMAKTLEIDPAKVDLFDPTIRKALSTTDPKTGKPGAVPLWQFEQTLRQDGRFKQTQGAQDQVASVGHDILKSFGLMGA